MIVEADPGQIGGGVNHEFMARATVGEDLFVECENGDYLADTEAARPLAPEPAGEGTEPLTPVDTPDTPTIDALATLLGVEPSRTLKCVMFDVAGQSTAGLESGHTRLSPDTWAPERGDGWCPTILGHDTTGVDVAQAVAAVTTAVARQRTVTAAHSRR